MINKKGRGSLCFGFNWSFWLRFCFGGSGFFDWLIWGCDKFGFAYPDVT